MSINHIFYSKIINNLEKHIFESLCCSENGIGFVYLGNGVGSGTEYNLLFWYEEESFGCDYCYDIVSDSFSLPRRNNLWFENAK